MLMSVYGQPLMLFEQLAAIFAYQRQILEDLSLVVVDDCGKPAVDIEPFKPISAFMQSVKLFRVTEDIPWNQHGCRNLAAQQSSGMLLFMDPDMIFDGPMMSRMIEAAGKLQRGHVIKWGLKHVNSGKLDMTSPNTWIIHRDDFFSVGGCDEDFSGAKGWQDTQMLDVFKSCFKIENRPDLFANFHGTDSVPDAMVKSLDRSTKHNRKLRLKKVAQARAAGGWKRWAMGRKDVSRIRFPWTQLYPPV